MKILQKVLWIWLFVLAFSLFNCTRKEFDCDCPDVTYKFLQIEKNIITHNIVHSKSNISSKKNTSDSVLVKSKYFGFNLNYSTKEIKGASKIQSQTTNFSLIPSVYACDCVENLFFLKNVYPISLKVYTKYSINDSITKNSLVNKYLTIEGNYNLGMKENNQKVDIELLLSKNNVSFNSEFEIDFLLNYDLIQNDSLQFRIETELNTGEILTTETLLVRFEN